MQGHATRPLAVDLFAGVGGLSLGLEEAGFDVAAAVELDPVHAAVHEFNFPNAATLCVDARMIDGAYIRSRSRIGGQEIALVAGGPPCQGISAIGRRRLDDPRNELLREYVRLVRELNPRYFLMENVPGLVTGGHRQLLVEVIDLLRASGYSVTPFRVLQAADYGTPQSRRRLMLLGARQALRPPEYPDPTCAPRTIDGSMPTVTHGLPIGPSVIDAIGDLPNADDYQELLCHDRVDGIRYGTPSPYAARLRNVLLDDDNHADARSFDPSSLTSSARTRHTPASVERFLQTTPGTTERISRFLRLHPDGVSNTLRAGTASDHGAYTAPRPIHPTYPRVITVREAARLHGYPDWFRFHVTKWNGFREVGNSVPIPLGRAVGDAVMRAGGWVPQRGAASPIPTGDAGLLALTQSQAEHHFGLTEHVIAPRERRG